MRFNVDSAIKTSEKFMLRLSGLATGSEEIAKKAIHEGAKVVADKMHANLLQALAGSKTSTGDLEASFGITPIKQDKNGNWNAKIGFHDVDRKGVPNQLKARALESGTSKQQAKPFVRPAINAARQQAMDAMDKTLDEEIKKQME